MPNQETGKLIEISQTQQIPSKNGGNPFTKREFLLDASRFNTLTGERVENILPLELSGDRCQDLDKFRPGDMVTVSFTLQGRQWTNQEGTLKRMTAVRCYRIEPYVDRQQQPAQQPAQPVYQQQQQYASDPPQYYNNSAPTPFPPPVDANGNVVNDPLPF